jgi:hypothetical protein
MDSLSATHKRRNDEGMLIRGNPSILLVIGKEWDIRI